MDAISFDRLVRSLATRPSRRRVTRALSSLTLAGLVSQFPEAPAGEAKKKKKVTLCHAGQTINVSKKKKKAHLKHGDTPGPCPPTTTTTTTPTTTTTSTTTTKPPPGSCAGGEGSSCGTDEIPCICAARVENLQLVCVSLLGIGGDTCESSAECAGDKVCGLDLNHTEARCLAPCSL